MIVVSDTSPLTALLTVGEQGMRFLVQIIIARLLLPEEYGLTAMIVVFVAIAEVLISSGFARAIIQSREPSHRQRSRYCHHA